MYVFWADSILLISSFWQKQTNKKSHFPPVFCDITHVPSFPRSPPSSHSPFTSLCSGVLHGLLVSCLYSPSAVSSGYTTRSHRLCLLLTLTSCLSSTWLSLDTRTGHGSGLSSHTSTRGSSRQPEFVTACVVVSVGDWQAHECFPRAQCFLLSSPESRN